MHDYLSIFAAFGAGLTLLVGTRAMARRSENRVETSTSIAIDEVPATDADVEVQRTKIGELVRSRILLARLAVAFVVVPLVALPLAALPTKPPELLILSQSPQVHDGHYRGDLRHSRGPHRRDTRAARDVP